MGLGCLFDLNFFETPVVNLRPNVKLLSYNNSTILGRNSMDKFHEEAGLYTLYWTITLLTNHTQT